MNRRDLLILIIILIYAFVIRVNYLGQSPLWIDETISASVAKQIVETGVPCFESGYCYWRAYLFHYGMAFFIKIFGGDFGAKFISVIFGVLTVLLGHFYGRDIAKSRFVSLAFPLLLAISTWQINYSKQARMYQAFCFFYFLTIYLFFKIFVLKDNITRNKYVDYFLLLISIILTIHMNIMGAFIALLFILMKSNEEKYFHIKIIFLILSLIGTLILISKITILIDYNLILNYSKAYFQTFFYPISLVLLYIIGLAITLKKKTTKLMFVFSIIPFLGLFFLKEYGSRYGYYITFSVLYFSCIAISKLKFNKAFLLIFIIINSSILVSPFGIVTNKYDFSMPSANYKDGYDYLKKLNITNKNIITTWSPASTWYGQKVDHQANYSLTGSKNSNFWRYYENSNKERFSSASIINLNNDTIKNKIVIADKQTTNKIDFQIFEKCIEKYNKENIIIYDC